MNVIVTENLSKNYADFTAVSKVNIQVPKGKVYGLLGPNGAGKSTLMKMFLGLTQPSGGAFTINHKQYPQNRNEILREVGSFIEAPSFYGNLTGEENLDIIRRTLGLPKTSIEEALSIVGLVKWKDRQAKKYSLGMKQRLGLAIALIGKPAILILDEPTNGLDPVGVHEIRTLIQTLPEKLQCTVILSSHLLSEIERVADTIGILNQGNLLFEGSIDELKTNFHPSDRTDGNLEDTFLQLIQEDNIRRGIKA